MLRVVVAMMAIARFSSMMTRAVSVTTSMPFDFVVALGDAIAGATSNGDARSGAAKFFR